MMVYGRANAEWSDLDSADAISHARERRLTRRREDAKIFFPPSAPPRLCAGIGLAIEKLPMTHHCLTAALLAAAVSCGCDARAAEPPRRIVSLAPNLTEMVTVLGAADRLAGVTPFCSAPEEIARITGGIQPEAEAVLALQPDLVLATPLTSAPTRQRMADLGIRVEVVDVRSLDDIRDACTRLAHLLGVPQPVLPHPAARPPAGTAVLLFGADTGYSAGPRTHANEILEAAGLRNIAGSAGGPWPVLNEEFLLSADPDWILVADHGNAKPEKILAALRSHPIRRHLRAVKEGRVITIPAAMFTIPGPASLDAAALVQAKISAP